MFSDLVDEYMQLDAAALDALFREHELEDRRREARRLAMVTAIEARQVAGIDGHRSTKAYLKAATNTSGVAASALVRRARACRDLPVIGDALAAGFIGVAQVDLLARTHQHPRVGARFDEIVGGFVDEAEHVPHRDLELLIDRWVMVTDTEGSWKDLQSNVEARDAHIVRLGDVLDATVTGGDPITADFVKQVFDGFVEAEFDKDVAVRAEQHGDQADAHPLPRTVKQRRFDAFVAMVSAAQAAAQAGLAPVLPKVVVNILLDQRTADEFLTRSGIALADGNVFDPELLTDTQIEQLLADVTIDAERLHDLRCETESGHPVHPILAVRALLTEHVRRVVLNSEGTRINFGREVRLFRGNAAVAARLLAPHCEHPGCDVAGKHCDIDHNLEWADGGRTVQVNSNVLHSWHNRFKSRAGWRSARARNGRAYFRRADGTLVLPAGERPPDLTDTEHDEAWQRRLDELLALRPNAA
ncbi:MAG TPA: DUF222 domain-containing protein [Ilumatobacter sp.]|nr:DUF222 domain-containing protein [Ilumatobacter sp.]